MKPTTELYWFGVLAVMFFGCAIVLPYIRRRRDLLTPTNFFLFGAIFFIGISAIDSSYTTRVLGRISVYSREEYRSFMLAVVVFFFGYFVAFRGGQRLSRAIARRAFVRWPPITRQLLAFMLIVSMILSLGVLIRPSVAGLGQIIFQISLKVAAMTIVLAFVAWYFDRQNPIWMVFLVGTFLFALILSVSVGTGRRTMLGAVLAIPIAYYWLKLRYVSVPRVLLLISVSSVVIFLFVGTYSTLRHRGRADGVERNLSYSIESLNMIPERFGKIAWGQMLGQRAVECSLLAGRLYKNSKETSLLHSVKFVVCNPIPRVFWKDKPLALGYMLPKDARSPFRSTWGPGIVGHGYYEGGLLVLLLYGLMAAICLRTLDFIVVNNPSNPFVLGIFASVSPHIFGWLRGDIGTFTIQIIGGIVAGVVLGIVGRMLFGTEQKRMVRVPRPVMHAEH